MTLVGGMDWIISNLDAPLRMRADAMPEMGREHLRAEADAEQRLVFLQRRFYPSNLASDPRVPVVDAHRSAENDHADVVMKRWGQRVAKSRAPDVKLIPVRPQEPAEPASRRMFLVQDNQNPAGGIESRCHMAQV
jgi:hypothetical protein